jgi:hypothetical protein
MNLPELDRLITALSANEALAYLLVGPVIAALRQTPYGQNIDRVVSASWR